MISTTTSRSVCQRENYVDQLTLSKSTYFKMRYFVCLTSDIIIVAVAIIVAIIITIISDVLSCPILRRGGWVG